MRSKSKSNLHIQTRQGVGTASLWARTDPGTETRESSRVYARENERKGHADRRTGTERLNKTGKRRKKTEPERAMQGCC